MTYSPSDVATGRASPGIDVHAGHSPRPRGSREVLSGTLGYRLGWLGTAPRVGQSFPTERLGISLTRRLPTPPDRPSHHYWPDAPSFFKPPTSPEQIQDHQIASSAQTMAKIGGAPGDS